MIHGGQEQGHDRGIDASTETPSRNKTRREDKTLMNAAQSRPHRPKKSQISPKMSQTLALNPKMSGRVEKHDPTTLLTSPVAGEKLDEPELIIICIVYICCGINKCIVIITIINKCIIFITIGNNMWKASFM